MVGKMVSGKALILSIRTPADTWEQGMGWGGSTGINQTLRLERLMGTGIRSVVEPRETCFPEPATRQEQREV